jgi:hypothetical protein
MKTHFIAVSFAVVCALGCGTAPESEEATAAAIGFVPQFDGTFRGSYQCDDGRWWHIEQRIAQTTFGGIKDSLVNSAPNAGWDDPSTTAIQLRCADAPAPMSFVSAGWFQNEPAFVSCKVMTHRANAPWTQTGTAIVPHGNLYWFSSSSGGRGSFEIEWWPMSILGNGDGIVRCSDHVLALIE